MSKQKPLAVIDFETDPFLYGDKPEPFAAGALFSDSEYIELWGDNCVERLIDALAEEKEPHIIYAHNGGKFDFFYLLWAGAIEPGSVKIIGGRIVEAKIGIHTLRDSYSIIPVPLAAYQKDKTDYSWFKKKNREKYKPQILEYLKSDCVYLLELVTAFVGRFGQKLTVGAAAITELSALHPFEKTDYYHDCIFREFYYGGRVECFESGIIEGKFHVFDVNSMYPYTMANFDHPTGMNYKHYQNRNLIDENGLIKGPDKYKPYFCRFIGENDGALPSRTKDGLNFNTKSGIFCATSHEIKIALKHKKIKIEKILDLWIPEKTIKFADYVEKFGAEKIAAKQNGDKIGEIFAKLMLNSAYGKFATNPANFYDWKFIGFDDLSPSFTADKKAPNYYALQNTSQFGPIKAIYELYSEFEEIGLELWRKPVTDLKFFDVATAASITGASRAVLLDALCTAKRPIYCDTDSIICEELGPDVKTHDFELGAWKLEKTGDTCAIAGKKLYAVFKQQECVKKATKGLRLEPNDILKAARGEYVSWACDAPNFSLFGKVDFVFRELNKEKKLDA